MTSGFSSHSLVKLSSPGDLLVVKSNEYISVCAWHHWPLRHWNLPISVVRLSPGSTIPLVLLTFPCCCCCSTKYQCSFRSCSGFSFLLGLQCSLCAHYDLFANTYQISTLRSDLAPQPQAGPLHVHVPQVPQAQRGQQWTHDLLPQSHLLSSHPSEQIRNLGVLVISHQNIQEVPKYCELSDRGLPHPSHLLHLHCSCAISGPHLPQLNCLRSHLFYIHSYASFQSHTVASVSTHLSKMQVSSHFSLL